MRKTDMVGRESKVRKIDKERNRKTRKIEMVVGRETEK
jgi:hypothetical protein